MAESEGAQVSVRIEEGPLANREAQGTPGAGAVLVFLGVVRPLEAGRPIRGLDYESYDPMAERVLGELASEAVERHGLLGFRVDHSRGFVPVGEASLRVVASGKHRPETLEAVGWFIRRLKEDVPIWKKARPSVDESGESRAAGPTGPREEG